MRRVIICLLTALVALAAAAGGARAAATSRSTAHPTRAQIRRAIRHAERSRYLWATINICRSHVGHGGIVGIRGEMGALGFRSTLSMTVRLREYDTARSSFVIVKGTTAARTVSLGRLRSGVHQDGAEFHYSAGSGLLDAMVTFTWTRDGRRLGRVTRSTSGGHHNAAFAQPKRHSAATCRL